MDALGRRNRQATGDSGGRCGAPARGRFAGERARRRADRRLRPVRDRQGLRDRAAEREHRRQAHAAGGREHHRRRAPPLAVGRRALPAVDADAAAAQAQRRHRGAADSGRCSCSTARPASITTLATGDGAPAGPAFANRTTRTLTWGVRPYSTELLRPEVPGGQQRQHDRRLHRLPVRLRTCPGRPVPRRPARRDGSDRPTNVVLSWISSDANSGALLTGGTTLVGLREGGRPARRLRRRGVAGEPSRPPARRPVRRAGQDDRGRRGHPDDLVPRGDGADAGPRADHDHRARAHPRLVAGRAAAGLRADDGGPPPAGDLRPHARAADDRQPPDRPRRRRARARRRARSSPAGAGCRSPSRARSTSPSSPAPRTCLQSLLTTALQGGAEADVSSTIKGQTIGIFVVRVTGKRKLLGRTVPRIKPVGRVPLGRPARASTGCAGTGRSTASG